MVEIHGTSVSRMLHILQSQSRHSNMKYVQQKSAENQRCRTAFVEGTTKLTVSVMEMK